jgi:hypothetical protein
MLIYLIKKVDNDNIQASLVCVGTILFYSFISIFRQLVLESFDMDSEMKQYVYPKDDLMGSVEIDPSIYPSYH